VLSYVTPPSHPSMRRPMAGHSLPLQADVATSCSSRAIACDVSSKEGEGEARETYPTSYLCFQAPPRLLSTQKCAFHEP